MLRENLPCFSSCLLPVILSLGTTEKNPASAFFALFLQVFIYFDEIILSLLQAEQSQHSEPFLLWGTLQSLHDLYGPLLDCLQYVPVSLVSVSCQGSGTCVCSVWWSSFSDPEVYSVTQSPFMKGTSSLLQSFNLLSTSWNLQRLYFLQPASNMVKLLLNLLFYFSGNSMQ